MVPKLVPSGGTANQVLTKTSDADHAVEWRSGSDADTLAGQSANYYTDIKARLGYVPLDVAGGTMTGGLTIQQATDASLTLVSNVAAKSARFKMQSDGNFVLYRAEGSGDSVPIFAVPGNAGPFSLSVPLTSSGHIAAAGSVYVGGDLSLNRTTDPTGYILRPNIAGYRNLCFAADGGAMLDTVTIAAANTRMAGSAQVDGNLRVNAAIFTGYGNGERSSIMIGDDAWIGDINVANAINIRGEQNPDTGFLSFGNSGQTFGKGSSADYFRVNGDLWVQNWLRVNGGQGIYFESMGRGLVPADSGASYGNVNVYGAGLNGWQGYAINNDLIMMANGIAQRGFYSPNGGGWLLSYDGAGNATFPQNVTAFSDRRLKTDIRTIEGALRLVERMRGVRYLRDGNPQVGVIAQEMEEVVPEVVMTADDPLGIKSVAYQNLVGVLIEAVKELSAKVDALTPKEP